MLVKAGIHEEPLLTSFCFTAVGVHSRNIHSTFCSFSIWNFNPLLSKRNPQGIPKTFTECHFCSIFLFPKSQFLGARKHFFKGGKSKGSVLLIYSSLEKGWRFIPRKKGADVRQLIWVALSWGRLPSISRWESVIPQNGGSSPRQRLKLFLLKNKIIKKRPLLIINYYFPSPSTLTFLFK